MSKLSDIAADRLILHQIHENAHSVDLSNAIEFEFDENLKPIPCKLHGMLFVTGLTGRTTSRSFSPVVFWCCLRQVNVSANKIAPIVLIKGSALAMMEEDTFKQLITN